MISEKEIADEIAEDDIVIRRTQASLSEAYLKACDGDFDLARIMAYGSSIAAKQAYEKLTKTQQALEAIQEVE